MNLQLVKKILSLILILFLFILSRFYIYKYWPTNYSDVRTDYERYARMWNYGLIPYTHHMYEYPPLTIPLVALPLKYEHLGVNYYHNYRFEVMVVDITFFIFLVASVYKLFKKDHLIKKISIILFYILITSLAKNFFYEGLDLIFMSSIFTSFLLFIWLNTKKMLGKTLVWLFFWISTAIKFLTLPLMIPIFLIIYSDWKKDISSFLTGFILIWGIPIIIFRSTLLVPFVLNNNRPIKNSSFPAYIIKLIDYQTNTETKGNKPPDFEYTGPVTSTITNGTTILFPSAMLLWLIWSSLYIFKNKNLKLNRKRKNLTNNLKKLIKFIVSEIKYPTSINKNKQLMVLLRIYGIYLFTMFFFAKIFSQPFHIWYMALIAIYPFLIKKNPIILWIAALVMVTHDTTTLLYLPSNPDSNLFNYPYFMYGYLLFKYIPMGYVYYYFIKNGD
ncbi:MAG: hypothetical protein OEX81_05720 [Candidatus Pacebacteria bacterium]|nr:hypothetical protein [Candidatus Paceibacterota bacterium]